MKLSQNDWSIFLQLIDATIEALQIPRQESDEVVSLISGLKEDIVET
jgi:hypothetical protein